MSESFQVQCELAKLRGTVEYLERKVREINDDLRRLEDRLTARLDSMSTRCSAAKV
jgi:uncharacterized protein YPO0396